MIIVTLTFSGEVKNAERITGENEIKAQTHPCLSPRSRVLLQAETETKLEYIEKMIKIHIKMLNLLMCLSNKNRNRICKCPISLYSSMTQKIEQLKMNTKLVKI